MIWRKTHFNAYFPEIRFGFHTTPPPLNSIVVLNFLFCFFKSYFYFIFNSTNKQNFRWSNRIITHVSVSKFLVKIVKGATKCKMGQTLGAKIAHLKVRG
jgi:hypothetical protein